MEKITSQDAALKLINDIAIIDTELAAKIKPSIDMFIESISDNDVWEQLGEFFKLSSKEEKEKWWNEHEELGNKIVNIHASMKKTATPALNEDKQKKEENEQIVNGETKKDIPIKSTAKEEKKDEDKKSEEKKDSKKDSKEEAEEQEEKPVEPKDLKLPEDGFKGDKITAPLKIDGDDKRFMGKTKEDLPKPEDIFPPKKPEVIDVTKNQAETVKLPDLSQMKTAINVESMRKMYKTLVDRKIIKESVDKKYAEFLDQCQLDWATTNIENGWNRPGIAKFVPIRKYATQLFDHFKDDFAAYEDAMAVTKEWYATQGRRHREAERIIPSNVYVELRKGKDSNFVVNVYLVKTTDLNNTDAEMASDIFSTYTDKFVDDQPAEKIWIKLPKQIRTPNGIATVYMIAIPFTKDNKRNIVLARVKHDIVNHIRADYKDYYLPTTRIPSGIYSQNESVNEAKEVDYKQIYKDVIKQIFFNDYYFEDADEGFDEEAAKEYIINKIPERLEYYCDIMDIDFVEASNALDEKDVEDLVDDFMFRIDTESLNESKSFEFVKDDVDYNYEMQQVISGLCEEYIDKWLMKKTTEEPVDFVLDRLNKEATLQAKLNDFDADEFINSFTIDELKKMIKAIMDKKWQEREDLRDAIDHDMEMRESKTVKESADYKDMMYEIIMELYYDYLDNSDDYDNAEDYILDHLKDAIQEYYSIEFDIKDIDGFLDSFTKKDIDVIIKTVIDEVDAVIADASSDSSTITESVEYNHEEVDSLAEEFIADLKELDANPWDMDVAEFIEWAWGRGNVPREEIPYISKRWDIFRTLYAR